MHTIKVLAGGCALLADEAPVFLALFGIPAAVALFILWRATRA